MSERVSIDAKLYRNTGSIASPTFVEVDNVRDVSVPQEWSTAEFKTRARDHVRHRKTLAERTCSVQMEHDPAASADNTAFEAFRDAFQSQTSTVILAILDADEGTTGSQGLHAFFQCTKMDVNQELEDATLYDFEFKLAVATEDMEWLVTS